MNAIKRFFLNDPPKVMLEVTKLKGNKEISTMIKIMFICHGNIFS